MTHDLDKERIQQLLGNMRESVHLLQELANLDKTDFVNDRHKQSSAKYNFVTAIEAAIDIANHIISRKAFRSPENYADTFQVLAEEGILDNEFAEELQKMARFRNRLVHLYWKLDVNEIWRILQSRLGDFDRYIQDLSGPL